MKFSSARSDKQTPKLIEGTVYQLGSSYMYASYILGRWFLIRMNDGTIPPGEIHAYREINPGHWLETYLAPGSLEIVDGVMVAIDPAALIPVATDGNPEALDDTFLEIVGELEWEWQQ